MVHIKFQENSCLIDETVLVVLYLEKLYHQACIDNNLEDEQVVHYYSIIMRNYIGAWLNVKYDKKIPFIIENDVCAAKIPEELKLQFPLFNPSEKITPVGKSQVVVTSESNTKRYYHLYEYFKRLSAILNSKYEAPIIKRFADLRCQEFAQRADEWIKLFIDSREYLSVLNNILVAECGVEISCLFISMQLKNLLQLAWQYKNLLRRERYASVFMDNYQEVDGFALTIACKSLNIKTYELVHGSLAHPSYISGIHLSSPLSFIPSTFCVLEPLSIRFYDSFASYTYRKYHRVLYLPPVVNANISDSKNDLPHLVIASGGWYEASINQTSSQLLERRLLMYLLQCLSGDSRINTTFVAHPRQSVGQELPSDLIGIIKNSGNIVIADQNPFDYSKADAVIIVNASSVWKHICEARIRVRFLMSSPLISYVLSEHKYWTGLCLTPADIDDFLAELRA